MERFENKYLSGLSSLIICLLAIFIASDQAIAAPVSQKNKKKSYVSVESDTLTLSDDELKDASARDLKEFVVKPKRNKYSKKNNPAVELMEQIRKDKDAHNPFNAPYYSYDKYEKTVLGLNNYNKEVKEDGGSGKKMDFFNSYVDTASTGKKILALSLREKYASVLTGKERGKQMEVVSALRSNGVDEGLNQENMRRLLEDIFREVNVYDNDIIVMQNRFVSPLSYIAADYYKFEITDTCEMDGENCIELTFTPHSPESFSFNGKLYIPLADSVRYVRTVNMRVPKAINLNYVDNLFIKQTFAKDSLGNTHKEKDDMTVEMRIVPGTPQMYASRETRYNNYSYTPTHEYEEYVKMNGNTKVLADAKKQKEDFWEGKRSIPLSKAQQKMGDLIKRFRKVPVLYWAEKVVTTLISGWITTGNPSKVDIGPMNTVISFNTAEGVRLRAGGITTANLSKRWFGRGYVAYGFRDRKVKYLGEVEYSFLDKDYAAAEFPVKSIRASYQYDKDELGQHYLFTNSDNMFLSLRRMKSDLITYRRLAKLSYNLELRNNFSFQAEARHEIQEATQWVPFQRTDGTFMNKFTQAVLKLTFRYAPGEKFAQRMTERFPINFDAPTFLVTHEFGPKGFMGSNFTLNKTEASFSKRFWFSSFGYSDVMIKGGIIWSKVYFPALLWQNANISYTIQPESFALLNPMEFAMDKFASWDITYFMNGLIFNRIPYLNKLKLREIFTFKGFVGGLSKKNNPEFNNDLLKFPGDGTTVAMGHKPYMEIGVGIDNIFTFLRLDYMWRLSYRDRPNIDKSGLRLSLHFSF